MGDSNTTTSIADYLAQLLKDKKQLAAFPSVFLHVERLLDEEINKVRSSLFQINGGQKEPLSLPEPVGPTVTLSDKVYVPVKDHPEVSTRPRPPTYTDAHTDTQLDSRIFYDEE
uniref:STAR protein homodimerisation region domain-containing protein n=1 Tax=Scylla olivacea TaxID=85551 RepID=A0A0P4W6U1_SCYOL